LSVPGAGNWHIQVWPFQSMEAKFWGGTYKIQQAKWIYLVSKCLICIMAHYPSLAPL
jgi:hypothetical protein